MLQNGPVEEARYCHRIYPSFSQAPSVPGSPCLSPLGIGIMALNARVWCKGKELLIQKLYRFKVMT